MPAIFKLGETLIGFAADAELLTALKNVSEKWRDIIGATDGRSFIEALNQEAEILDSPQIIAAFQAAGLGDEYGLVRQNSKKLLSKVNELGKRPIARLFDRIGDFQDPDADNDLADPGLIQWKPFAIDAGQAVPDFMFSLTADASIEFEAGDRWPYASDATQDKSLNNLLRIGAQGTIEARAGVSLPFNFGFFNANAAAEGAAHLDYYYLPASDDDLYGITLSEALVQIPNPLDFGDIWGAFQKQGTQLKAINLGVNGDISFDAEVGLAIGRKIKGVGGIQAGLGVRAKVWRRSRINFSMRAVDREFGASRAIQMVLTRVNSRATTLGVDLRIELDSTDLAEKLSLILREAMGTWNSKLDAIKPLLSPGSYLRDALKVELENAASALMGGTLKGALLQDARTVLGVATGQSATVDWLKNLLVDAFTAQATAVRLGGDAAVDAVAAKLQNSLGRAFATETAAGTQEIKDKLEELVSSVSTAVTNIIGEIAADLDDQIGDALSEFGIVIAEGVSALDKATEGIRKLFERFDQRLKEVALLTEEVAAKGLQVELGWEETRLRESEFLVSGIFTADTVAARAVFRALKSGDGREINRLLRDGTSVDGFELDRTRSYITRVAKWQERASFRLILFGFEISSLRILSAEAVVTRNGDQSILITTKTEIDKAKTRPDGSQFLRFTTPFNRIILPGGAGPVPIMTLSIDVTRFEKRLSREEISTFLKKLGNVGLVSNDIVSETLEQWRKFYPNPGTNKNYPGTLDLGLSLDAAAVRQLLRLSNRILGDLDPEFGRTPIERAAESALKRTGAGGIDAKKRALVRAFEALGDIYEAPESWEVEDYERAGMTVAKAIDDWLPNSAKLFKLSDQLRNEVVALMLVLVELGGVVVDSGEGTSTEALLGQGSFFHLAISTGEGLNERRSVIV